MEVVEWEAEGKRGEPGAAFTLGVFDGVHLGHQALIKRVVEKGPRPTAVTFRGNPKRLFAPESYPGDILSFRQRLEIFEALGLEEVIVIDFSSRFSKISGSDFITLLAERRRPGFMALGADFRCGRGRDAGAALIKGLYESRGIPTEVLPPVEVAGGRGGRGPVSSTRVRAALAEGYLDTAEALLGRPVEIDLRGLAPRPGPAGGAVYEPGAAGLMVPGDGAYRGLLLEGGGGGGEGAGGLGAGSAQLEVTARFQGGRLLLPERGGRLRLRP